ncbi:type II toxin-antitoxin system ParD family antitoxin [Crenothrix sp.]|uniref:ribbon-helix-helix domain-containing protein n=1 Tax=Crenothrix sp. TaxID=3100433 RepID=UPI00374C9CBA
MIQSKHVLGSDLSRIDAHVIQPDECEEISELTDEFFEQAILHVDGKLIRPGRPKAQSRQAKPKSPIPPLLPYKHSIACSGCYSIRLPLNFGVKLHQKCTFRGGLMIRQSISFTAPNDKWLNNLVEREEYSSKSEIVNDLIRKARTQQSEIELIRAKLIASEKSGFINQTTEEIRAEFKAELRRNGEL